jgi:isopentenyl diphosphate isomerase/L-lactate dehydrogenase-like FMN-dependent dehydrogenase
LYGLAAAGYEGASDVLSMLRRELEFCMKLVGCTDIDALDTRYLAQRARADANAPAIRGIES